MMQRLNIVAGCVTLTLILGGGIVLSSCASTNYTYTAPSPADIPELIMEWDRLERTIGQVKPEFREQYAKALKALSNAIAEQDVEAARAAMRTHLANSRERLRKSDPDSF